MERLFQWPGIVATTCRLGRPQCGREVKRGGVVLWFRFYFENGCAMAVFAVVRDKGSLAVCVCDVVDLRV